MSHRVSEIQRFSEIGAIIAISFFIVVGAAFSASEPEVSRQEPLSDEELWEEIRKDLAALMAINLETSEIQPSFQELSGEIENVLISTVGPSQAAPILKKLEEFANRLTKVEDFGTEFEGFRTKLEKLIIEEPEKILALPLLKNKIDMLSNQHADLRDEVRRVYGLFLRGQEDLREELRQATDLFKWLIGALYILALSVAAMTAGVLLKLRFKHS